MKPVLKIILPIATVAIVAGGWLGLSAYASKQADREISGWLYKNDLDMFVQYRSVKASPFGGSATLQGVEIVAGGDAALDGPLLSVEQLSIADLQDDDNVKAGTFELEGVRFSDAFVRDMASLSGRTSLAPIDIRLSAKLDVETGELEQEAELDAPEMIAHKMQLTLGDLRGVDDFVTQIRETISALAGGGAGDNELAQLYESLAGGRASGSREFRPENVTLVNLDFTIRDQGAFRRASLIRKRYEIPLDPGAGDADRQRDKAAAQKLERELLDCEKEMRSGGEPAIVFCQTMTRLKAGDSKGMRLRLQPDDRVRLMDFLVAMGTATQEQQARMIRRLNLQVDSL